jgi:hypothetical protein
MDDREPVDLRTELAEPGRMSLRQRIAAPDRYGVLLILTLSTVIASAALADSRWQRAVAIALIGVTLLYALRTSRAPTSVVRAASLTVPVLVVGTFAVSFRDENAVRVVLSAVMTVLVFAVLVAVLRRLATHLVISWNTILGAVCVYLLLGMVFSAIFAFAGYLQDGALFVQQQGFNSPDTLYFSFITLTTVGYGDLTMRTEVTRMLAASEALLGQLYLITTVGLVVGNLGRQRPMRAAKKPPVE